MEKAYRVSIITVSDKCSKGLREDRSGAYLIDFFKENNWEVADYIVIPDEYELISNNIRDICDNKNADLIITTGGTGFSVRDITPEATKSVIEREVPGISEFIRSEGQKKTPRSILSRGISGIRKRTLIINFPGSIKAVKESIEAIFKAVRHGVDILTNRDTECGEEIKDGKP
ncbi:MAG: MogA/MoaB family molybdenum cofactor biosynthesis protein [Actinomycetota bacterium]|jgi:molybdenum cofactor synthesis domain-containing protein|nr:MogA/MoaB family molybdenum cofactor biosynthesis protein [Actinomycetota bacterium]